MLRSSAVPTRPGFSRCWMQSSLDSMVRKIVLCRAVCRARKTHSHKVRVCSPHCQRLSHANSVGIEPETVETEEQVPRDRVGLEMLQFGSCEVYVDLLRLLVLESTSIIITDGRRSTSSQKSDAHRSRDICQDLSKQTCAAVTKSTRQATCTW